MLQPVPNLHYVDELDDGIRRVRRGRGFAYRTSGGATVRDAATIARIRALAIPPAWTDVWICADADGHLQAIGRDARGRKQYRYHADWRAFRDRQKFDHLVPFARALPHVRRRIESDLALPGLPREKVLATLVRLLELTHVRIGNEEYARVNGSYGLSTLRRRHVRTDHGEVRFVFVGKSGRRHSVTAADRRVVRIIRRCQEIPGQRLFQYVDEHGEPQPVRSHHVNDYLRETAGLDVTAKDFRTWTGTVAAAAGLALVDPPASETEARHEVRAVITDVARDLGNTPAVCRASYVHPRVLVAFTDGTLQAAWQLRPRAPRGLDLHERRVLAVLAGEVLAGDVRAGVVATTADAAAAATRLRAAAAG